MKSNRFAKIVLIWWNLVNEHSGRDFVGSVVAFEVFYDGCGECESGTGTLSSGDVMVGDDRGVGAVCGVGECVFESGVASGVSVVEDAERREYNGRRCAYCGDVSVAVVLVEQDLSDLRVVGEVLSSGHSSRKDDVLCFEGGGER